MGNRTHLSVTRQGWYYIAMLGFIIAGAIIRDINLLYIMAGIMFGPLLLSVFLAIQSLRRLRFERRFAPIVSVGDPLIVELEAEKQGKGVPSFAVIAQDRLTRQSDQRRSPRIDTRLLFSHIPVNHPVDAAYRVRLHQRGRYRFGPLKVSTSMPLGLIRATSMRTHLDQVLVSPRIGQLLPAWSRKLKLSHLGGQKSMHRRGKTEGDFYGIRDWRTGDSRNWIHWRTSAKRSKLSVRQFEQRISQDLAIVLDLWQPTATRTPPPEVELAVSFVATLVIEHGRHGSTHIRVASASRTSFSLNGTSSPVFRHELMGQLAVVEPTRKDRLPEVLTEVLPKVAANTKVVVVSTRHLDLRDTDRFASIWTKTNLRRMLSEIVCVDTNSSEFSDWFREQDDAYLQSSTTARIPSPLAEDASGVTELENDGLEVTTP